MLHAIMPREWTFSVNIHSNDIKARWQDCKDEFEARYAAHNTMSSFVN